MNKGDQIIASIGKAISYLSIALIIIICVDVTLRYIFAFSKNWIIELEWHLFALIFIIGSAFALQKDKHVRVDVFYQKFSDKAKCAIDLIGHIIFLLPWCYVVVKTSFKFAYNSWYIREGSAQPGGLPARYVIKGLIVVGFVLLAFQGVLQISKSIRKLLE